jgi:hypothetical protein
MRPIKFRGKDFEKKWIYGDLKSSQTYKFAYIIDNYDYSHSVNPNSVGQFTGWKDCTGTEIYEGDILSLSGAKSRVFEVYYNEDLCSFCLREYTRTAVFQGGCPLGGMLQIEKVPIVIGNVFDNPGLLKREK